MAGALAGSSALASAGAAMGLESSLGGLEGLEEENRLWRGPRGSGREVLRLETWAQESELRAQGKLLLRTALLIEEARIMFSDENRPRPEAPLKFYKVSLGMEVEAMAAAKG